MLQINSFLHNPIEEIRGHADGYREFTVQGHAALALLHLMQAGKSGYAPTGLMMPAWHQFVRQVRKAGAVIDTVRSNHFDKAHRGLRLRYVLRSEITITSLKLAKGYNHAP
ncbi:winged helix domain-containing protein [Microvirga aerophila]|uniref:Winged helix domain-containing protein n=1 Tax=Microvirga aerophila TaxID=670291 RepID=A0A512BYC9_9HYPH|nr:hypothetical protein [Microvirga aerophila]GEO16955.1 hypothetical protein MAE02_46510 [Microvirga aerophila]